MPAKFDRCVAKVKAKGRVRNAYAVCKVALKKTQASRSKTSRKKKR